MRSNTITNAMISWASNPGWTTRLKTSSPSKTLSFTFFLAMFATTSPFLFLILQFLLQKQPSILKSGVWSIVTLFWPDLLSKNTWASAIFLSELWKKKDLLLIIEKILFGLGLLIRSPSSPLYAFHWCWMLKTWSNKNQVGRF